MPRAADGDIGMKEFEPPFPLLALALLTLLAYLALLALLVLAVLELAAGCRTRN